MRPAWGALLVVALGLGQAWAAQAEVEEDPGLEGPLPRAAGWTSLVRSGGRQVRPEAGEPGFFQGELPLRSGQGAVWELDLPGQVGTRAKARLELTIDAGFEPCDDCKAAHAMEAPILPGRGGRPHVRFVLQGFDACSPHHGAVWRLDQPRHTLPLMWAITCP